MHSFCFTNLELYYTETTLVVQWLRLHTSTVEGTGLTPDWGTKISHALWCGQKRITLQILHKDITLNITYFFYHIHSKPLPCLRTTWEESSTAHS